MMMMMMIMMLMMVMMMQGNACQLYPEVISFYSEPQHAIAWPKITINVANNNKKHLFGFDLLWLDCYCICMRVCFFMTLRQSKWIATVF